MICDLQTGQPINLLPDRSKDSLAAWLKDIYIVSRDGSMTYRKTIHEARESIIHITDRFHVLANLYKKMTESLKRLPPQHWSISKETNDKIFDTNGEVLVVSNPVQEPIQEEFTSLNPSEFRKWALIQKLQQAYRQGQSIRSLARHYKLSRKKDATP